MIRNVFCIYLFFMMAVLNLVLVFTWASPMLGILAIFCTVVSCTMIWLNLVDIWNKTVGMHIFSNQWDICGHVMKVVGDPILWFFGWPMCLLFKFEEKITSDIPFIIVLFASVVETIWLLIGIPFLILYPMFLLGFLV